MKKKTKLPKKISEVVEDESYTPPDSIRVIPAMECDVEEELAKLDGYEFEMRHREFSSYGDY